MAQIPTKHVRRKADGAECIINDSDFDPKLHEEWKDSPESEIEKPKKKPKE